MKMRYDIFGKNENLISLIADYAEVESGEYHDIRLTSGDVRITMRNIALLRDAGLGFREKYTGNSKVLKNAKDDVDCCCFDLFGKDV